MSENAPTDDLWGALDRERWPSTPCIEGRAAVEQDVRDGRAVYYVEGPSKPIDISLPHCARLHEEGCCPAIPVIIIQAERPDGGDVLIGYRPLSGGNGICTLDEIELVGDLSAE
jgi:hypothetical protein